MQLQEGQSLLLILRLLLHEPVELLLEEGLPLLRLVAGACIRLLGGPLHRGEQLAYVWPSGKKRKAAGEGRYVSITPGTEDTALSSSPVRVCCPR